MYSLTNSYRTKEKRKEDRKTNNYVTLSHSGEDQVINSDCRPVKSEYHRLLTK
jgi:hypothetical protein